MKKRNKERNVREGKVVEVTSRKKDDELDET